MQLPDSLADNMSGELLPFQIKQSSPKTRTISLHIAQEVRSGTLAKELKMPVRGVHSLPFFPDSLPVPTEPAP